MKGTFEGGMEGKRPEGRRRVMMLDDMKEKKDLYAEMKERVCDRDNWRT